MIVLNKLRFRITHEERSLSTLQLVDITEHKINKERKIFTLYLPLFILVALGGLNLMYLDLFGVEEISTRILYHLALTTGIALSFVVGISVRIKRFHKQFLPLLERIRKFKMEST